MKKIIILLLLMSTFYVSNAQEIDEGQLGAWYMYFFNKKFEDSRFGLQGDYQFRYWDGVNDLEQLLLRTGVTYRPKSNDITFTLGYAFIKTGAFGESNASVIENRIYQEALIPQKIGSRFYLTHRMRYEQRWVQDQQLRTRFRYNLFLNVPLNKETIEKKAIYLALYNEIFINGQTQIGDEREVQLFDRNRTYLGIGYGLSDKLRTQIGWMNQTTTAWAKGQLQFSIHHNL